MFVPARRDGRGGSRRLLRAAALAAAFAMAAGVTYAAPRPLGDKPRHIVSLNLCADQLLMLLVERERIASITYIAADPNSSYLAEQARGLRLNYGYVEEVLALNPDLVLATTFVTRPTVPLLRKFGYKVVEVPIETTLADVAVSIRIVAEAVGEISRGETLIADFEHALAEIEAPSDSPPLAASYWANGFSSGRDTLAHAVIERAGFRNLAAERGVHGTRQIPLETLIAARPDLLILGRQRKTPALASEGFSHPALRQAFGSTARASVVDGLWVCGTPLIAQAVESLAAQRAGLKARR